MNSYFDGVAGEVVFLEVSPTSSHDVRWMGAGYSVMGECVEFRWMLVGVMERWGFCRLGKDDQEKREVDLLFELSN